jgi:tetraacyldisaccharide 4'-kinase
MSGEARGIGAGLLRAGLAVGEVPYALVTRIRNKLFDARLRKSVRLPRPVVSIGNITAGGTGKTPAVRWLAERLRDGGKKVAILSRGYKSKGGELGDEPSMLQALLNGDGNASPVFVRANAKRARAGQELLHEVGGSGVDVFILDDGFQHRQLARDFDLVLIDATAPFGYGHVFPRGMLREPVSGLVRATAFMLTRVDEVESGAIDRAREVLRRYNPSAPLYETVHAPTHLRHAGSAKPIPLDAMRGRPWFAFCGIATPTSFLRQLETLGGTPAGSRAFADHHTYGEKDVAAIVAAASKAGANVLVTTEKDWVKLERLPAVKRLELPLWRLDVKLQFLRVDDEAKLLRAINARL